MRLGWRADSGGIPQRHLRTSAIGRGSTRALLACQQTLKQLEVMDVIEPTLSTQRLCCFQFVAIIIVWTGD